MDDWRWKARVDADADPPVTLGAGFLIDSRRVLTCAHAVDGYACVRVSFPGGPEATPATVVRLTGWARPGDRGDVALLRLESPVAMEPARFARPDGDYWAGELRASGYRAGLERTGSHVTVRTGADIALGREWWQLDVDPDRPERLAEGFSGAAVYRPGSGEVVGMVTDVDLRRGGLIGAMLPLSSLRRHWEDMDDLLDLSWLTAAERAALRAIVRDVAAPAGQVHAEAFPSPGWPREFRSAWQAICFVAEERYEDDRLPRFLSGLVRYLPSEAAGRLAAWGREALGIEIAAARPAGQRRPAQMGHAFISYDHADSLAVDRLQRKLEAAGIQVWRDTANLWPGEDWRAEIRRAITDDALAFIACFSRNGLTRSRNHQNEELALAIDHLRLRPPERPWLIPVRFDDCEMPDRDIGGSRTLTSLQCADLFGDRADESAARLVASVRRILGQSSGVDAGAEIAVLKAGRLRAPSSVIVRLERCTHDDAYELTLSSLVDGVPGHSTRPVRVQASQVRDAVENSLLSLVGDMIGHDWMIEFALPEDWLCKAVEEWKAGDMPFLAYPVVVRDVERLKPAFRQDQALQRWAILRNRAMTEPEPVGCADGRTGKQFFYWLTSREDVCVLVHAQRPKRPHLASALKAGIPVMVWPRAACRDHAHGQCAGAQLAGELLTLVAAAHPDELPRLVKKLRAEARSRPDDPGHCGRRLTLFWDDPTRLPDPPLMMAQ